MRVLQVAASVAPELGGTSTYILNLGLALAKHGAQVTQFTLDLDDQGSWVPFRRSSVSIPYPRHPGVHTRQFKAQWPSKYGFSIGLMRGCVAAAPTMDLVHCHSTYLFTTLASALSASRAGKPYIVQPHGSLDPYTRRNLHWLKDPYHWLVEGRILDAAAAIHCTSEEEARALRPLQIKSPRVVVPAGIWPDDYSDLATYRGTFRYRHGLQDKILLLFLGRLAEKKGFDRLIPAFQRAHAHDSNLHLVLAGPDFHGYRRVVEDLVVKHGVKDNVTFTGFVAGPTKLAVLADADIWVLPSAMENFGIAVTEAMACGIAVVISDQVNIAPIIGSAGAGVVVSNDVEHLTAALLKLAREPDFRDRVATRGRELALEQFTWDAAATQLLDVYEEIVQRGSPTRHVFVDS